MHYNCITKNMEKIKKDSKTTINIRIDSSLKNEAEFIINSLGLSTSTAIVLFFKALVREKGLPFDVKMAKEKGKEEAQIDSSNQSSKTNHKNGGRPKTKKPKKELSLLDAINKL